MKLKLCSLIIITLLCLSCKDKAQSTAVTNSISKVENKGKALIEKMVQKVGDYNMLHKRNDVVYTYTYKTPDGRMDRSTEKYLFDGELSYGAYEIHERTFPELDGQIDQGYDGSEFWLKHNGDVLNDSTRLKRVAFNRPTNFYWFAMFQKLLDPGLHYEYLGDTSINAANYDIVKVSFKANDEKPTDTYQLYINKSTHLVDQFLFTVVDFGVVEEPYLMQVSYETVDGMVIPAKRQYKKSTWEAEITDEPWIYVTWTDIKFNNGLSKVDFKK